MPILQLSVFAENKPGAMTAITRILGEAGVDIRALSLADTSDYGILRLIVDKPEQAQKALDNRGYILRISPSSAWPSRTSRARCAIPSKSWRNAGSTLNICTLSSPARKRTPM